MKTSGHQCSCGFPYCHVHTVWLPVPEDCSRTSREQGQMMTHCCLNTTWFPFKQKKIENSGTGGKGTEISWEISRKSQNWWFPKGEQFNWKFQEKNWIEQKFLVTNCSNTEWKYLLKLFFKAVNVSTKRMIIRVNSNMAVYTRKITSSWLNKPQLIKAVNWPIYMSTALARVLFNQLSVLELVFIP